MATISGVEKMDGKDEFQVELQMEGQKDAPAGFIYEDPDTAPKKSPAERRLVLKVDLLIVGLTSLVFLVNQWVSLNSYPQTTAESHFIDDDRIEATSVMPG